MVTTLQKLWPKSKPGEIFAHDLEKAFFTVEGDDEEQVASAIGVLNEAAAAAPARLDGHGFIVHAARVFRADWQRTSYPTVADGTAVWPLSKSNATGHLKFLQELSRCHPKVKIVLHHRADLRTDRCEAEAGTLREIGHDNSEFQWAEFKGKIVHPEVLRQDAGIIVSFKPMRDGSCKSTVIQEAE